MKGPFTIATLGLLLVSFALEALAQPLPTRSTMPASVVLVLKRLDAENVQPTTGVVVDRRSDGVPLVLVPAAFVGGEEELYVLDEGTDLLLDGLPAERLRQSEETGLAVLAVPGLKRRPLQVTFNAAETDHEVRLAAFPPAEMLASGALPYWIPVNVAGKRTGEAQRLVEGATAPNITGPLLDLCGQLAGMVLATSGDGSVGDGTPRVVLNDDLLRAAESLSLDLNLVACMQVAPVGGVVMTNPVITSSRDPSSGSDDPFSIDAIMRDAQLGKGALVFLLSALVSGLLFWIFIKRRAAAQRRAKIRRTLAQDTVTFSASGLPTRHTRDSITEARTFNPGTRPPGTNGWLRIEGTHADGRPLRAVTAISEGKFQAVIGRAGVALAADGPGISRKHAVIVGEGGRLTISDLGSRNGTFVNGVRCQPDEIFFIEPGDTLLLGAAEVKIAVQPAKGPVT